MILQAFFRELPIWSDFADEACIPETLAGPVEIFFEMGLCGIFPGIGVQVSVRGAKQWTNRYSDFVKSCGAAK